MLPFTSMTQLCIILVLLLASPSLCTASLSPVFHSLAASSLHSPHAFRAQQFGPGPLGPGPLGPGPFGPLGPLHPI